MNLLRPGLLGGLGVIFLTLCPSIDAQPLPDVGAELTSAQQVRLLGTEEARRGHPVKLRGVVTFCDPTAYLAFVQDRSAGIFVIVNVPTAPVRPLRAGSRVEVSGITSVGSFSPLIAGPCETTATVDVLGEEPFPEPQPLGDDAFSRIAQHCQWVEVCGLIRSGSVEDGRTILGLQVPQGRLVASLPFGVRLTTDPAQLVGARARVRGVFSVRANYKMQSAGLEVLVPTPQMISVDGVGGADPFSLAISSVGDLLRFNLNPDGNRVRVCGTVTFQKAGEGFFVSDPSGGAWVQSRQRDSLWPGDRVDVVGFPGIGEGYAVLEDSVFHRTGSGAKPAAVSLKAADVLAQRRHAELVEITADLVEHLRGVGEDILILRDGYTTFHARLDAKSPVSEWKSLQPGGRYRVTGVSLLRPGETGAWTDMPGVFKMVLRSAEDVRLMAPASGVTLRNALWLLSGCLALLAVATGWALLLRRQVRRQTGVIGRQLREQTLLDERARIARELHDSLGQDMAGITIQLDAAAARLEEDPAKALGYLHTARSMLRHAQGEARRSVWSLRAYELEAHDLPAALRSLLLPLIPPHGRPEIQIVVSGAVRRLPDIWENHLLRIAQEAVTNAVRHASAKRVQVALQYAETGLVIEVSDDGAGFEKEQGAALPGRFGLLGMRERAGKMNGRLEIDTCPGAGTIVRVEVDTRQARLPSLPAFSLERDRDPVRA